MYGNLRQINLQVLGDDIEYLYGKRGVRMRKGWTWGLVVLIALAAIGMYVFRITEDEVVANRMLDFEQVEPGTEMIWNSKDDIRVFEYAVRFAKKNRGVVDISAPPYSFKLHGETYLLYALPKYDVVQFINSKASGTLYTVGKSSAKKLKALLTEADKTGFGVPTPGSKAYIGYE